MNPKDYEWSPSKDELDGIKTAITQKPMSLEQKNTPIKSVEAEDESKYVVNGLQNGMQVVDNKPAMQNQAQPALQQATVDGNGQLRVNGATLINIGLQKEWKKPSYYGTYTAEQLETVPLNKIIKSEIRSARVRSGIWMTLGILLMGAMAFFIGVKLTPDTTAGFVGLIPNSFKIPIGVSVLMGILGLASITWGAIHAANLKVGVKSFKASLYNEDEQVEVPYFIRKHFFGMTHIGISINFICGWLAIFGLIAVAVLWAFTATNLGSLWHSTTFTANCNVAKIVCYSLLGADGVIWFYTLFSAKYHRERLQSYFNGRVAYQQEITEYKKMIWHNWWVGSIIFLIVITLFIYFIVKACKRHRQGILGQEKSSMLPLGGFRRLGA